MFGRSRVTLSGGPDLMVWRERDRVYTLPTETGVCEYSAAIVAITTAQHAVGTWLRPASVLKAVDVRITPPRGGHPAANSMGVVCADWVPGVACDDAHELNKLDSIKCAAAILQHNRSLVAHGWCRTATRLSGIVQRPCGNFVFVTWGDLCRVDCARPPARLHGVAKCARPMQLMAASVVMTLAELAGEPSCPRTDLAQREFRRARLLVSAWLPDALRASLDDLLQLAEM